MLAKQAAAGQAENMLALLRTALPHLADALRRPGVLDAACAAHADAATQLARAVMRAGPQPSDAVLDALAPAACAIAAACHEVSGAAIAGCLLECAARYMICRRHPHACQWTTLMSAAKSKGGRQFERERWINSLFA